MAKAYAWYPLVAYLTLCHASTPLRVRQLPPALEEFRSNIKPQMNNMVRVNNLTYGESCDIHAEMMRKAIERRFLYDISMVFLVPKGHPKVAQHMLETVNELDALPGPFCNTFKNLECSTNLICECSKEDEKTVGFKGFFQLEQGACVLSPGSMCVPPEVAFTSTRFTLFNYLPLPELTCARGSNCVVKSTGQSCTAQAYVTEFERMVAHHTDPATNVAFRLAKSAEGTCICAGATLSFSIVLLTISLLINVLKQLH